jgi:hypothetical protein
VSFPLPGLLPGGFQLREVYAADSYLHTF